jgi:hypothetical protein
VERDRRRRTLKIHHQRYIRELLSLYGFDEGSDEYSTPVPHNFNFHVHTKKVEEGEAIRIEDYRSVMGSLIYLAHWSRPDILYAVSNLASNCSYPNQKDWEGVTHVMRFLNSTSSRGIVYGGSKNHLNRNQLYGFADANYAGDLSRRSRTGCLLLFNDGAVVWKSHLQGRVSQSTTEAEYYSLAEAYNEVTWCVEYLNEIGVNQQRVTIFEDNTSTINIATNPISHPNTKQIAIRYHLLRDGIRLKEIKVEKIESADQLSDVFTKALDESKFRKLTSRFME